MSWIPVAPAEAIPPGDYATVEVDGAFVAVFNVDGEFFAIDDVCTHDGGELAGGPIEGFEVECVRHGAKFDLRTGAATCPPAYIPTVTFPVKVEAGAVWTRDNRD